MFLMARPHEFNTLLHGQAGLQREHALGKDGPVLKLKQDVYEQ